ncbi:hypothetical protein IY145_24525 [Methylosinus sp. H3A]|uniref:hypothetical protein n=1 Tax=Methylosinus sp. H3A TaxID=2785786 RepID=UPI0018C1FB83|nr:hypothetical protein [Methylosinus sp. H3A]MBG0812499.1 hypothetical protein [Methylosinus sp. H3A]
MATMTRRSSGLVTVAAAVAGAALDIAARTGVSPALFWMASAISGPSRSGALKPSTTESLDRRRSRDDIDVAVGDVGLICRESKLACPSQFHVVDVERRVAPRDRLRYALCIDIEPKHIAFLGEFDGERQPHIAETDDSYFEIAESVHRTASIHSDSRETSIEKGAPRHRSQVTGAIRQSG